MQDSRAKELGTRMLTQDSWDRTAWEGQLGQDSWRKWGWYRQDKKERTGWPAHERRTGQLGWDN
jgi:hypothetical protein